MSISRSKVQPITRAKSYTSASIPIAAADSPIPFLYETPAEICHAQQKHSVVIADHAFDLYWPTDVDQLLDHPQTHAAFAADEYMPYWAELWPSSRMLAAALLTYEWPHDSRSGANVWEIGCGLGLPGLAALSLGMHVTFSDYDGTALRFAARNAITNGYRRFKTQPMDWRHPPIGENASLILAADVIYEARCVTPLVQLMVTMLAPKAECWLVDPNRSHAPRFRQELERVGLRYTTTALSFPRDDNSATVSGTLFRIRQRQ